MTSVTGFPFSPVEMVIVEATIKRKGVYCCLLISQKNCLKSMRKSCIEHWKNAKIQVT